MSAIQATLGQFGRRKVVPVALASAMFAAVPSHAAIVDIDGTSSNGTVVNLAAGTYTVSLSGRAEGGAYDAYSPWSSSTGCDANGANCATGYTAPFAIDFGFGTSTFTGQDGYQYGFFPTPSNTGLYETAALANAAYRSLPYSYAPLPQASDPNAYSFAPNPITFTLAANQQVRFFILDYPYNDNRDGVSLSVIAKRMGAVPEPASWTLLIIGFGFSGAALRSRRAHRLTLAG